MCYYHIAPFYCKEVTALAQTRKTVGRTVTVTECNGQRVNRTSGEFVDFVHTLVGEHTPEQATMICRRMDPSITINNVEVFTDYYTMPTDKFIALATKQRRTD